MKEYTDLFPEGTSGPSGNKQLRSLKEINSIFLNKTHDIQFIMSVAASDWLKEFICWEQINCLFRVLGGIPGLPQNDVTSRGNKHGTNS